MKTAFPTWHLRYGRSEKPLLSSAYPGVLPSLVLALLLLGPQTSLLAQVDDFNDNDDDGWIHRDPREDEGAPALFMAQNGVYRLSVTAGSDPWAYVPMAASYPPVIYTNFYAFVDVVDWNEQSSQAWGLLARYDGLMNGFYCIYYTRASGSPCLEVGAISTGSFVEWPISLDPTRDYRLVFSGDGPNLIGEIYSLTNLSSPLIRWTGVSYTHTHGYVALGAQPWSPYATADVTYDNFAAFPAPPDMVVVRQPEDQTVEEGQVATFRVEVFGAFVGYQWQRDGIDIAGAVGSVYSTPPATWGDDNAVFSVRISGPKGWVTSSNAVLWVVPDVTPPRVVNGLLRASLTDAVVVFTEPVLAVDATDPLNYDLRPAGGGERVWVNVAILTNWDTVLLKTEPFRADSDYVLRISQIHNASEVHLLAPNPTQIDMSREIVLVAGDGQEWRYFQSNCDPGAGWQSRGFNDTTAGWQEGVALFDAKRPAGRTVVGPNYERVWTVLNLTNPPGATEITRAYYFRTHFDLPRLEPGTVLRLKSLVDDGALFYLNGVEVERWNMPAAPELINYSTFASHGRGDESLIYDGPREIPATNLVAGDNVLAVEVHQIDLASSDMSFAAELMVVLPPIEPRLRLLFTEDGLNLSWTGAGYVLEEAPTVVGPWGVSDVQDNPQIVSIPAGTRFFRLRRE